MNKSIVLDIDGVLANFEKRFCAVFGNKNRDSFCLEDRYPERTKDIQNFVKNSATYESLEPLEIGQAFCRWAQDNKFDIHIVSSRPAFTERTTGVWLKYYDIPFHFLSVDDEWRNPKIDRIRKINPVFAVDDSLWLCKNCAYYGIPSFLIDYPWNQSRYEEDGILYRIRDFYDFLGIFDKYFDF